jgi:hypothetical protein
VYAKAQRLNANIVGKIIGEDFSNDFAVAAQSASVVEGGFASAAAVRTDT